MYWIGPDEKKGFMFSDMNNHPDLDEECRQAWKIMEQFVLDKGFDSGCSFGLAQRGIQAKIKEITDLNYIFHEE